METKYAWGHGRRYNDFATHFRNKFNGRVQKVSIDAGFTCPNRDGSKGTGGCAYCNNKTFKPSYCDLEVSVSDQLAEGIEFFSKRYDAINFLAYFQAYSNTYAPVAILRDLYEEALRKPRIIGLVIATRPDCLTEEVLDLLQEFSKTHYVMVELGLESHKNETLKAINRGHTWEESERAIIELARRGIHNCAHLIIGLPGETHHDFMEQARVISKLPIENLKLHQLQIHKRTRLAIDYAEHPEKFDLFDVEGYLNTVVEYIELLNPKIIIERFISTAPHDLLIAPKWGLKNNEFVNKLDKQLEKLDTYQGKYYSK